MTSLNKYTSNKQTK